MSFIFCAIVYFCQPDHLPHSSITLPELRERFQQAVVKGKSSAYFEYNDTINPRQATAIAYKACSYALHTQNTWNPILKVAYLKKYSHLMEIAMKQSPDCIEIRFLRLSIEYNIPRWLGMSEHMNADSRFIATHTPEISSLQLDPTYAKYILYFLQQTTLFSEKEITLLKIALNMDNNQANTP